MKRPSLFPLVLLAAVALVLYGDRLALPWGWVVPGNGADLFIVLHEAQNRDAAFSTLATTLQDSATPQAQEIAAAGWTLQILDDDQLDGRKQPHPLLQKLGVFGTIEDNRRELLAIRKPDTVVHRETLAPTATAETVMATMRAKGVRK